MSEPEKNISIFHRGRHWIKYKIHYVIKYVILNLFYRRNFAPKLLKIHAGSVLTIFFFQKVLRQYSHVPFPVHHANFIGSLDKTSFPLSVQFGLAVSGGIHIQTINGVEMGEGTLIAAGVKIYSANHSLNDLGKHIPGSPVRIGKNCWLGTNSVILAGVELGDRTIVAAGAVVNKSFPGNCIIGGVPAKLIKRLDPNPQANIYDEV